MINFRRNLRTQRVRRSVHTKSAILFILILLLAITAGCKKETKTAGIGGKTTIVVADAKTTHHLNLYVAKELGVFDKYNLNVQITAVDGQCGCA